METAIAFANDAARHPVRRGFPPPAIYVPPRLGNDLRLFLMTYVAGFVVIYGLIA